MAFFTIQRNGFKNAVDLAQQVIEDMVDHGFTVVYPSDYVPSSRVNFNPFTDASGILSALDFNVILQAGPDVDPLAANQPWRIGFRIQKYFLTHSAPGAPAPTNIALKFTNQSLFVAVATNLQLKDDGTWQGIASTAGTLTGVAGAVGKPLSPVKFESVTVTSGASTIVSTLMDSDDIDTGFINREKRFPTWTSFTPPNSPPTTAPQLKTGSAYSDGSAFPLNYRLTITSRGVFLGVFEGNWASIIDGTNSGENMFNWLLVQRPVNKDTGAILSTGKSPVFCINCVNKKYWRFVVRESDIPHPTPPVRAEYHSEDNFKLINPDNQISLTEDKKYTVSFIHNLNTPRFRYSEELDMVSVVSADIIMESVNIPITAYGSSRIYTSLPCNDNFNTGAKVIVLTYQP